MRRTVHMVIKNYLRKQISITRSNRKWSKRKMSEELAMDERSYSYIEKGESACSAVTFILYLLFVLKEEERADFLHDLREEIVKNWEDVA